MVHASKVHHTIFRSSLKPILNLLIQVSKCENIVRSIGQSNKTYLVPNGVFWNSHQKCCRKSFRSFLHITNFNKVQVEWVGLDLCRTKLPSLLSSFLIMVRAEWDHHSYTAFLARRHPNVQKHVKIEWFLRNMSWLQIELALEPHRRLFLPGTKS